jgi:uncharacterized protein YebE (UPF0316 family)
LKAIFSFFPQLSLQDLVERDIAVQWLATGREKERWDLTQQIAATRLDNIKLYGAVVEADGKLFRAGLGIVDKE